ncbi:MAG: Ti-type conjugative transfer relaxase TraA [Desulfomonilia bacterium]|jgi:Ti-type conjugative transfer relaxase TraA
MACYHSTTKIVSRSSGRSAVSAAAYRSREKLYDERQDLTFDYTKKKDLAYAEILLPEGTPERLKDRQTLWNEVERVEKRKDAQLAREVELALPKELNLEQQIGLVREYVQAQFVDQGMIADICIHKSEKNPHVHILLTTREVTPNGFGNKQRSWNDRANILIWREEWANIQNRKLLEAGYDIQVDHRSFEDRGIDLEPTTKIGIAAKYLPKGYLHLQETRGLDRLEEYQRICRENGERIINDPVKALKLVGHYDAVFKREDIMDFAFRHSADADQFNRVLSALENSMELIKIGKNDKGEDLFSTRTMMMSEKTMLDNARVMRSSSEHVLEQATINQTTKNYTMSEEQEKAFRDIAEGGDISVMIGRAGTGKSYTLGAVKEAYEAGGYRVRGLALSGIAAEGLQNESGIESTTIFRQLDDWENERNLLSKDQILVIDEAGMVGTRQMHEILNHAHEAGAKVILVGDNEQLQSIEAGGSFRGIIQRTDYAELAEVRRQQVEWQKQATLEFSGKREQTEKALETYHNHGHIRELQTREEAKEHLLKDWAENQAEHKHNPGTSLMMAYTNKDVNDLNQGARQYRKMHGELRSAGYTFMTEKGERTFSKGDRIIFLRNEHSLGVRNGSLGTVESISRGVMAVKLDKGDRVAIDTTMYRDFDHGYAATVHKTQGSTLDNTFVLGSRHFDKHTAYVAMSRHRENVTMYYGKDEFRNFEDLQRVMSREQAKGLIVDYSLPRGIEIDDRLIKAEKVRSYEEIKQDAEQRLAEKKRDLHLRYEERFYSRIEQKLHERAKEEYRQKQQERGINVEFVRDKEVEGYYTRALDIDGRRYAVIESHADLTKGTCYMVPYDKQYDQMHMHRYVVYDGWEMKEVNKRILDKERQLARDQEEKRQLTHDRELNVSESKYCQLMQAEGLQVAFINEKTVEGYFTRIEEVGENKYAVIETKHGVWCMVPYDKQYDNMQTQRYVEYDGHKMSPAVNKSIERDLNQGKGLGLER